MTLTPHDLPAEPAELPATATEPPAESFVDEQPTQEIIAPPTVKRLQSIITNARFEMIPYDRIIRRHPAVPLMCVDSYPTGNDQPDDFTMLSAEWLSKSAPIGVVGVVSEKTKLNEYFVISGFSTWRILASSYSTPRRKKIEVPVLRFPGTLSDIEIEAIAKMSCWLPMLATQPREDVRISVFARMHQMLGMPLLKILTPGCSSLRKLAENLCLKSHASLSVHLKPTKKDDQNN